MFHAPHSVRDEMASEVTLFIFYFLYDGSEALRRLCVSRYDRVYKFCVYIHGLVHYLRAFSGNVNR